MLFNIVLYYYFACIIDIILFLIVVGLLLRALILLIFQFMAINMQSCIVVCIGNATTSWHYWRCAFVTQGTYPEVACISTSGQDGLRRQNIRGGRSLDPPLRRKEPTLLGDVAPLPVAGCTVNPEAGVHSRVRLRAERDRVCDDVTVPGGGTTWKKKQVTFKDAVKN